MWNEYGKTKIICLGIKGKRITGEKIGNKKKRQRISIIAGLNYKNKEIIAPFYYNGYTNTEVFIAWVSKILLPTLRPKHVIIMDNATFHKSTRIKKLIESKGCKLLYLPTYSHKPQSY